jgi:Ca2+-binding RTX toxin-like protein
MALPYLTDEQIIDQLDSGYHWGSSTISYSFAASSSVLLTNFGEAPGFAPLNDTQKNLASLALRLWNDLIGPNIVETPSGTNYLSSDIEFGSTTTTTYGYAYSWFPSAGSVWFNTNYNSGVNNLLYPQIGQHGYLTFLHETGHSLGLNHMGDYNGSGATPTSYQDSDLYSVMSYFGPGWGSGASNGEGFVAWADWRSKDNILYEPQTPMLNDILAIQHIYGADPTTRATDTTYGFNCNISGITRQIYDFSTNLYPILTIYDAGGNDTLDLSGWDSTATIDLAAGAYSSCNYMTYNVAIAYNTNIENAIGGSGQDTMSGNTLDNLLNGRIGNDYIYSLSGNDTIIGGLGNDYLDGGEGIDTAIFTGNLANYTISNINGVFTVADNRAGSPDGTDTVIFTEKFQFADQTIDVTNSVWDGFVYRDLNGNGAADLLWLRSSDYVALLTNASGGFGSLGASTMLPAGSVFANFAQIDGAGGYEPIWSKSGTGVMIGNGAGTPLTFTQKAVAQPNGVGWSYWQSANMNGAGGSELLWKYGESIGVTFLDASQNKVSDNWYGSPGAGWTAVAAADLNGDGRSDILWRNDAAGGALASTLTASDGKSFTSANWLSKPGAGWDYYGVGDFNGDGRADTAWTNQNDYMAVMMTGADGASTTGSYWFSKPGEGWEIQGIGDFNNDGRADTLWWNDAFQGAADFLTEATLNSSGDPNAYGYWLGSPGAGWSYAGLGDFNGDQRMDTLFQNAAGDAASLITNAAGSAAAPQWIGSPGTSWSLVG